MGITGTMDTIGAWSKEELGADVEVAEVDTWPSKFYSEVRKWQRVDDVVVVVGDLASSTKLNVGKHTKTSCRIYESATGGAARVLTQPDFGPEFVDIQGDGLFALYHGPRAYERAFCAATTLRTWSERHLVPEIEKLGDRMPKTGFKVGMARGTLAVKNVGVPRTDHKAPVWAGKPVNWAFKCAQDADRHEMIVTEHVHDKLASNDYVRFACGCQNGTTGNTPTDLWTTVSVDAIGDPSFSCRLLKSAWCENCGDEFCQAILEGKTRRDDVTDWMRQ